MNLGCYVKVNISTVYLKRSGKLNHKERQHAESVECEVGRAVWVQERNLAPLHRSFATAANKKGGMIETICLA